MYCSKCGNHVAEGEKFCSVCGEAVNGAEVVNNSVPNNGDEPNIGFALLGFFIPLAGIILYFVWKSEYPLKARSCIRGFLTGVALYVIAYCCLFSAVFSADRNRSRYYYDAIVEIAE